MSEYDAFELCVRSDGRRFIANIGAPDMTRKDDVWQCFFFPRGGPEWENITVIVVYINKSTIREIILQQALGKAKSWNIQAHC